MLIVAHREKERDVAGERSHGEIGQHFCGTNILVLVPTDKHNIVQQRHRNENKN